MKAGFRKAGAALLVCAMLMSVAGAALALAPNLKTRLNLERIKEPIKINPKWIRLPRPTGEYWHAFVNAREGLPVYKSIFLSGETLGRLSYADVITVDIYTYGVGKVIAYPEFDGFVSLSGLVELSDENIFEEGDRYWGVIQAYTLPGGVVQVWSDWQKVGDPVGTIKHGQRVIAQNYDTDKFIEVWHDSGVHGFVDAPAVEYLEPYQE